MNKPAKQLKLITCHLGQGCSIAAIDGGEVMDTSMGFTPLDGFMMGTRSGGVDPSAVLYLMEKEGWTPAQASDVLNKKSGALGISGVSNDERDIKVAAEEQDNKRAQLSRAMLRYQIRKFIGAYAAALNGVDGIVFTGGIGENNWDTREAICEGLTYLGVDIDTEVNAVRCKNDLRISTENSRVAVWVIPTNEELLIARETAQLL